MTPLRKAAQQALINFENMAESNWRNWQELASAEVFEKWVKRRASHMAVNLRKALEAEQAQAVEPVAVVLNGHYQQRAHIDDGIVHNLYLHPAPPPAGERAELIHWLRERSMWDGMIRLIDAADMLEADAQQRSKPHGHCTHPKCRDIWSAYLEATEKLSKYEPGAVMHLNNSQQVAPYDQQALELCPECDWKAIMPGELCFVCNMQTDVHQVAAPTLKIKPFTQRLRDNREADYSLDALMPPTRKEIESAMHEEIVELRGALKAQQVAVPDKRESNHLKDIYAFLASTAPPGIADEAFRNVPDSILPDSLRSEKLSLHTVKSDADGKCLGLAKQDSDLGRSTDGTINSSQQVAVPDSRPQNCGTNHCSCIECPYPKTDWSAA